MKNLVLLLLGLCMAAPLRAQLFVDSVQYSASELAMDFFNGQCVDVIAAEHIGQPLQKTFFEGSQSGLGLNAGILLTTGDAKVAIGPNDMDGASGGFGAANDSHPNAFTQFINSNALGQGFDQSVLHLTIIPHTDSLGFKYIFASEEYCEYVGSQFNDVFGFLIAGPGIPDTHNISMVPGTDIPVAINNVNHLAYPQYYRNNQPTASGNLCGQWGLPADSLTVQAIQYDGLTTVLTASAIVIPDSTYEIWIGISDIGDGVWDSGIFLSIESLCGDSLLSPVVNFNASTNGNTVTFQNTTKYATAWHWDFGDGTGSEERFPTHTFDDLSQHQYTVTLVATNYCCSDTIVTTIGQTTAVADPYKPDFRVFPTHFTDHITVETGQSTAGFVQLIDPSGRVVRSQNLSAGTRIDTADLPGGLYFLSVQVENNPAWVKKVVK